MERRGWAWVGICDWKLFALAGIVLTEEVTSVVRVEDGEGCMEGEEGWINVRNDIGAGERRGEMRGRIEVPFAIRYPS